MDIIFATKNKSKMLEIKKIMSGSGFAPVSLDDSGISVDIVEDGNTFAENAIKKAEVIMRLSGRITLADDSGLEIDYLDKAPGVLSARYLGEDTDYCRKNEHILDLLKNAPDDKRTARFVCVIAAALPPGVYADGVYTAPRIITEEGIIEGIIARSSTGKNGFGYDPIFFVPEHGMTTADMSPELKNAISHRGKALRLIKDRLLQILPHTH